MLFPFSRKCDISPNFVFFDLLQETPCHNTHLDKNGLFVSHLADKFCLFVITGGKVKICLFAKFSRNFLFFSYIFDGNFRENAKITFSNILKNCKNENVSILTVMYATKFFLESRATPTYDIWPHQKPKYTKQRILKKGQCKVWVLSIGCYIVWIWPKISLQK
jgi:hypothetical protein